MDTAILGMETRPKHENDGVQIYYDRGIEYVYRDYGGQRTQIAKVNRNYPSEFGGGDLFMEIQKATFSASGDYLLISYSGWEGGSTEVYDIDNNKKVHEIHSPSDYAFSAYVPESWLAECQGSGMAAGYVRVFNLPDWTLRYEHPAAADGTSFGDCRIGVLSDTVEFSTVVYDKQGTGNEEKWIYDILEDKLMRQT